MYQNNHACTKHSGNVNYLIFSYRFRFHAFIGNYKSYSAYAFGAASCPRRPAFPSSLDFRNLAGLPTHISYGGTSFVTTDPAAIIAPRPIATPFIMSEHEPIHTSSPMTMGSTSVLPYLPIGTVISS